MRVIVFLSLANAQNARAALDTKLGFPRAGTNAVTQISAPTGSDGAGWTLTGFEVVSVVDVNGVYGAAGTTYYLLGPIPQWLETRLLQLANPPTIATVPASIMAKGTRYAVRLAGWSNGVPTTSETPATYDTTVGP